MGAPDAVIFLCSRWDRVSRRHLAHLQRTMPTGFDLWVLCDARAEGRRPSGPTVVEFSLAELRSRGYLFVRGDIVPGSAHIPILEFARQQTEYRYFWVIEYDVAFTGRWDELLRVLSAYDADLIASHLRRFSDEPQWQWWEGLDAAATSDTADWVRGFFPFYRLSRRACDALRSANLAGRASHFEAFIPTELRRMGLDILDCGDDGEFTPDALKHRFYTSSSTADGELTGSMRYRPCYSRPGKQPKYLYHPVKRFEGDVWGRRIVRKLAHLLARSDPKTS